MSEPREEKCIVKDCPNHRAEGTFVNDLCMSCYQQLRAGKINKFSTSFLGKIHNFNKLTPAQIERLALLQEELNEAGQAICKILRHGYESKHPHNFKSGTNRNTLEEELGQVLYSLSLLSINEDVQMCNIQAAQKRKAESVVPYLHHQTTLPTFEDKGTDSAIELMKQASRRGFEAGFFMALEGRTKEWTEGFIKRAVNDAYAEYQLNNFAKFIMETEENAE